MSATAAVVRYWGVETCLYTGEGVVRVRGVCIVTRQLTENEKAGQLHAWDCLYVCERDGEGGATGSKIK